MSRILAFEWRRAVSLRSTWGFLGLGMAMLVFIAWAAMIFNSAQEGAAPESAPSMEGVAAFDGGGPLGILVLTTVCAQAFGHEYRDGTMRLVLSQFPQRATVFLAKVAVPSGFVTASILLALGISLVGAAVLFDVVPQQGWGEVAAIGLRQVGLGLWWGLIVVGVTALIRNLAAGIIVSLVFALILENLAIGLLVRTDPATGEEVSRAPLLTDNLPFTNALEWAAEGGGRAAMVAVSWAAGVVGLACVLFIRRDA
jgi:ABC-type transport system involved in multi-copper enzyme maturation permease subunit